MMKSRSEEKAKWVKIKLRCSLLSITLGFEINASKGIIEAILKVSIIASIIPQLANRPKTNFWVRDMKAKPKYKKENFIYVDQIGFYQDPSNFDASHNQYLKCET